MRIAVIGCGEVGRCYINALAEAGIVAAAMCDSRPSPAAQELAARLGTPLYDAPGPWLAAADLVLSAVVGGQARAVAAASLPALQKR